MMSQRAYDPIPWTPAISSEPNQEEKLQRDYQIEVNLLTTALWKWLDPKRELISMVASLMHYLGNTVLSTKEILE